jgi:hypothetical protein
LSRSPLERTAALFLSPLLVFATLGVLAASPAVGAPVAAPCLVPSQAYPTITSAVSGSCSTIAVSSGTYDEQVVVTRPLTLMGVGNVVIAPTSVTANACRHGGPVQSPYCDPPTNSNPSEAAIILVEGTTGVTIRNITVDGSLAASSITSCAPPRYVGILFSGASGRILHSKVKNLYQSSPSLYGCQDSAGLGIYVQSQSGHPSNVIVRRDVVTNFQKNGVSCVDPYSSCLIRYSNVSPLPGATSQTGDATNGIEVAFGASGTVVHNRVSGAQCNISEPVCGPDLVSETQATGILLYGPGAGSRVSNNRVTDSDIGLAVIGPVATNGVSVGSMTVVNDRYAGVYFQDGTFTANRVMVKGPCEAAVFVAAYSMNSSATINMLSSNPPSQVLTYSVSPYTATAMVG